MEDANAMSIAPVITIFVRHSAGCKYEGDETSKRCDCRKHLRWTQDGKQRKKKANTRTWAEAEQVKRELEAALSGKPVDEVAQVKPLPACIDVFIQDKRVQRIAENPLAKYTRELARLQAYCEGRGVYTIQGVTREVLTGYMATWDGKLSPVTQNKTRERLRGFLRYCYEAEWLSRIPVLPTVKADMLPTLPLTHDEYKHLLTSIAVALPNHPGETRQRVRGLFLLMRWSGLAIHDALLLRRSGLCKDEQGIYRVETDRQKTGTHVSVPLPPEVAEEILGVPNTNPVYLFWSGNGLPKSLLTTFQRRFILPVFKAAGLYDGDAHMVSHRLRDTFAVHLLENGVPMEEVSKALGHTSIRTTEKHYAKWAQGRQDRLDRLVMGTWAPAAKPKRRTVRVVPIA
jgi:integrase/recombinase XerD